jgi:hypothetical protein
VTTKRNGSHMVRPVPRTVEAVPDDLTAHDITEQAYTGWVSADLLEHADFPEPNWAVAGIIPQGTAIQSGAPKLGKSTMAMNLAVAVATGQPAFDAFDTVQGDVLYATLEDGGPQRITERLSRHMQGAPFPPRIHITTHLDRLNEGGIEKISSHLDTLPAPRLLILDTLQRVRSTAGSRSSGQYGADYEAVSPLTKLASDYDLTVLMVHHNREMHAEDWIDSVTGTRGLSGNADTVLVAVRGRGETSFILHATGRDISETSHAFAVDFSTFTVSYTGNAAVAQLGAKQRAIVQTLTDDGPNTPTGIAEAVDRKVDSVAHMLKRMVRDGHIRNNLDGSYSPIGTGATW